MRYGATKKIVINAPDEIEMIEDLARLGADSGELLKEIGYYDREEFSRKKHPTRPSSLLSKFKSGKTGFLVNEFINLLTLYEVLFPEKYGRLLQSHYDEYSALREFSLARFVRRYSKEMTPLLETFGRWIHPIEYLNDLEHRMKNLERDHSRGKPLTDEEKATYVFAKGTAEEIKEFWKEHYSHLTSDNVDGIKFANALRELFIERVTSKGGIVSITGRITREEALKIFPLIEV
jgi:hypothetical protein